MFGDLLEVCVLEILRQFAFAELGAAARLGHQRKMGIGRQWVTQRHRNKGLTRRIGKVFLRADHVRNLEVVIVHHAGEVIQAGTVGPLNDVILLAIPRKLHPPSHSVINDKRAFSRHLQSDDARPSFKRQFLGIGLGPRCPLPAV